MTTASSGSGGGRYFEELLARIRDIRSSEKVFWRKVLDIYATSTDYDPQNDPSKQFFAVVQNKMHWASHGHTAAEIIQERADAGKPFMGMTSWAGEITRLLKKSLERVPGTKSHLATVSNPTAHGKPGGLPGLGQRGMDLAVVIRSYEVAIFQFRLDS